MGIKTIGLKGGEEGAMEDQVIILPIMKDGVAGLGDLWDCRSSTSPGNLFDKPLEKEHLEALPISVLDYTLHRIKDARDKVKELHVSAELSLDVMAGKVKIEGKASFDQEDKKKFHEEEIICNYDLTTYEVRLRPQPPGSKEIISPVVNQRLSDDTIIATHYVQAVILGGQSQASIKYYENVDSSHMHLTGSLEGSIDFGAVKGSAKLELELLDTEYSEAYSTDIQVKAQPKLKSTPATCAAMFKEIENLDKYVNQESHFPQLTQGGRVIFGVPLRYRLVPLCQIIPFDKAKYYKIIAQDILQDFTGMICNLEDFSDSDHTKALLKEQVPNIIPILQDELHPLTRRLSSWSLELMVKAKLIKLEALETFQDYKYKKKSELDLQEMMEKYEKEFPLIEIMQKIQGFKEEAKQEMNGIHASDVIGLVDKDNNPTVNFLSNESTLNDWYNSNRTIKLLLQTNSSLEEGGGSPNGVFLNLFQLSLSLTGLGIEIGVAFPLISKDFSLSVKTRVEEMIYKGKEIPFVIKALTLAIDKGDEISSIFYSLNAELFGLRFPLGDEFEDLHSLVHLMRTWEEEGGVLICETYPNFLSKLKESGEGCWNFVLPIQGIQTNFEMMRIYHQARNIIKNKYPKLKHSWLFPKFNLSGLSQYSSPAMLVFKEDLLSACCFDQFDVLILIEQLKSSSAFINEDSSFIALNILSINHIHESPFYIDRVNFLIEILPNLILEHSTSYLIPLEESIFFPSNKDPSLEDALSVLRSVSRRKEPEVLNSLAILVLQDYPDFESILLKFGWIGKELNLKGFNLISWDKFSKEIQDFIHSQAPFLIKVSSALEELKELSSDLEEEVMNKAIKSVIQFLLDKHRSSLEWEGVGGSVSEEDITLNPLKDKVRAIFEDKGNKASDKKTKIINTLQTFLSNQTAGKEFFNLFQFLNLTNQMKGVGSLREYFLPLAKVYCERVGVGLKEEDYPGARERINHSISNAQLYKTCGILNEIQNNSNLYIFHRELVQINQIPAPINVKSILEKLTLLGYSKGQLEMIWTNPKFLHLIRTALEMEGVLDSLYLHLKYLINLTRFDDDEDGNLEMEGQVEKDGIIKIPLFIPNDIGDKVKPLFASRLREELTFDWIKEWIDLDSFTEQLKLFLVRGIIPRDFMSIFITNLEANSIFKRSLIDKHCLFYWDEEESIFSHPWTLFTISTALDKLMTNSKSNSKLQGITIEPLNALISISRLKSIQEKQTSFELNDIWKNFSKDGVLQNITYKAWNSLNKRIPNIALGYDELEYSFEQILPYALQNLKMFDSKGLDQKRVGKFINYPPFSSAGHQLGEIDFGEDYPNLKQKNLKLILTRGDILTALFHLTDEITIHNILLSLTESNQTALPLLINGIEGGKLENPVTKDHKIQTLVPRKYKLLFNALKNIIIQDLESILVPQPHLFERPFRFVLTLRVGDTSRNEIGRSSLINQYLMKNHNSFGCLNESGSSFGKPLSRNGMIEFIWLSSQTCEESFWKYLIQSEYNSRNKGMILIGILHGDALIELPPLVKMLEPIVSSYVVFWRCKNWPDLGLKKRKLALLIGEGKQISNVILYPDKTISDQVEEQNIILHNLKPTEQDPLNSNRFKLHNIFKEAIKFPCKAEHFEDKDNLNFPSALIEHVPFLQTKESQSLLCFIKNNSIPAIKSCIQMIQHPLTQQVTCLFKEILELPPNSMNSCLTHLKSELAYLHRISAVQIRLKLDKLRKQIDDSFINPNKTEPEEEWILEIQEEIKRILEKSYLNTLNLQDLFRLISNSILPVNSEDPLIKIYSQVISDGFAVELFNPRFDPCTIWGNSIKLALKQLGENTRVFILSIVGLKDSGKSMLLNRLFGIGFNEASIPTFGFQMRLLWLEEELKQILNCDAFLVIDSEGVGSSENKFDDEAQLWERKLTTFLFGISNLTLINVLGPELAQLSPIIEISLLSLFKLDIINIPNLNQSRDQILIQQQIKNQSKTLDKEFISSIQILSLTLEKRELEIGINSREMQQFIKLNGRIKQNEFMQVLSPLLGDEDNENESDNSFAKNVAELKESLLTECLSSRTQRITLGNWIDFTDKLWNEIHPMEFPFNQKSLVQMEETFILNEEIMKVKQLISAAFLSHEKILINKFTPKIDELLNQEFDNGFDLELDNLLEQIMQNLCTIINTCEDGDLLRRLNRNQKEQKKSTRTGAINSKACQACSKAFDLREILFKKIYKIKKGFLILQNISELTKEAKDLIYSRFAQSIIARQIEARKSVQMKQVLFEITNQFEEPMIWVKFLQFVSTFQTVIPSKHLFCKELVQVYSNLPQIPKRYSEGTLNKLVNLEEIPAFDLQLHSSKNNLKSDKINWTQADWLTGKLEELPTQILKEFGAGTNLYNIGMGFELRERIQKRLNRFQEFCGEKILPAFLWEAHLLGVQLFGRHLEKEQKIWDGKNNPVSKLIQVKEQFLNDPPHFFI